MSAVEQESEPKPGLIYYVDSIASPEHPESNHDVVFFDPNSETAMVLHGVSPVDSYARNGAVIAQRVIAPELAKISDPFVTLGFLSGILEEASDEIRRKTHGFSSTTATVIKLFPFSQESMSQFVVMNIGDGLALKLGAPDGHKEITQETFYNPPYANHIMEAARGILNFVETPQEAQRLPEQFRYLLLNRGRFAAHLGQRYRTRPDIQGGMLFQGGRIGIFSPGVGHNLKSGEIFELMQENQPAQAITREAHRMASRKDHPRAFPSDISAIVIEHPKR
ncbi:MAG TPA: hypothetical protein VJG66_03510 [Patescibacteria group bacterium]|nr:hypothetical protein [Patescibacteria group bacterium]